MQVCSNANTYGVGPTLLETVIWGAKARHPATQEGLQLVKINTPLECMSKGRGTSTVGYKRAVVRGSEDGGCSGVEWAGDRFGGGSRLEEWAAGGEAAEVRKDARGKLSFRTARCITVP